jgi:hypothetical protein
MAHLFFSNNYNPETMPKVIHEPFFDVDDKIICPNCEDRFAIGSVMSTRGFGRRARTVKFLYCDNPICIQVADNSASLKPITTKITTRQIQAFTLAVFLK